MKINKIRVQDYRSLGDCTAIGFASNIAVLVGRNEAGKSNVIDALSNVRFFEDMGADVIPMTDRNRIRNNSCVRVSVDLEYDDGDIALLNGVGDVPDEERKLCLLLLRDATTLRLSLAGLFCGVLRRDSVMREVAPVLPDDIRYATRTNLRTYRRLEQSYGILYRAVRVLKPAYPT